MADAQPLTAPDFPLVGDRCTGYDPEQRRFSGPVSADETNTLAGLDLKVGMREKRQMAISERNVIETKKDHETRKENFLSVRVGPVRAGVNIDGEPAAKLCGVDHRFFDQRARPAELLFGDLENELVVDGEEHFGTRLFAQLRIDVDHRALDDVGGRALNRRVERHALAERAQPEIRRLQLRQIPDRKSTCLNSS